MTPKKLKVSSLSQKSYSSVEWEQLNPVLLKGEFGYDTDKDDFKIGDGVTSWSDLPYFKDNGEFEIGEQKFYYNNSGTFDPFIELDWLGQGKVRLIDFLVAYGGIAGVAPTIFFEHDGDFEGLNFTASGFKSMPYFHAFWKDGAIVTHRLVYVGGISLPDGETPDIDYSTLWSIYTVYEKNEGNEWRATVVKKLDLTGGNSSGGGGDGDIKSGLGCTFAGADPTELEVTANGKNFTFAEYLEKLPFVDLSSQPEFELDDGFSFRTSSGEINITLFRNEKYSHIRATQIEKGANKPILVEGIYHNQNYNFELLGGTFAIAYLFTYAAYKYKGELLYKEQLALSHYKVESPAALQNYDIVGTQGEHPRNITVTFNQGSEPDGGTIAYLARVLSMPLPASFDADIDAFEVTGGDITDIDFTIKGTKEVPYARCYCFRNSEFHFDFLYYPITDIDAQGQPIFNYNDLRFRQVVYDNVDLSIFEKKWEKDTKLVGGDSSGGGDTSGVLKAGSARDNETELFSNYTYSGIDPAECIGSSDAFDNNEFPMSTTGMFMLYFGVLGMFPAETAFQALYKPLKESKLRSFQTIATGVYFNFSSIGLIVENGNIDCVMYLEDESGWKQLRWTAQEADNENGIDSESIVFSMTVLTENGGGGSGALSEEQVYLYDYDWQDMGGTYEVTKYINGIDYDSMIWYSATTESLDDFADAGIVMIRQGYGEVTFCCKEVPQNQIGVLVRWQ